MDELIDNEQHLNVKDENSFPGYSTWEKASFCCTNNAIKVHNINSLFLGHWEADFCFPIVVTIIIVSSYLVAMLLIFPNWGKTGIILASILSILFFLFIYSYFRIIIDGPGYLPFYWPLTHNTDEIVPNHSSPNSDSASLLHSDDLSPSGIVSTEKQLKWAKARPRPPRCTMSKEGKRFVLRPDHVCGWTASWIGKRNYKFFLLFNFWGFIYILFFLTLVIVEVINQIKAEQPSPVVAVLYMYGFIALTFLFLTGSFCLSHTNQMIRNQTSWEDWKNVDSSVFDNGCQKNVEDVCGPSAKWYTYIFPMSPWLDFTNNDLINDYPPYPNLNNQEPQK